MGREVVKVVRRHRLWRHEVNGAIGFVEDLCEVEHPLDPEWVAKMFAHYSERARRALDAAPAECADEAAKYRARLERCKLPA